MKRVSTSRMFPLPFTLAAVAIAAASGAAAAEVISYTATLSGPAEEPPNASPGIGTAQVDIDVEAHTMRVRAEFSGLLAGVTAAHVHAATTLPGEGTAGVATQVPTFTGFPAGVMSGTYDQTFDTSLDSTWNPAFITANGGTALTAEAAFAQSLADGTAYFNIHSTMFTGGEIRGFLVPGPGGGAALLVLLGVAAGRRRRCGAPRRSQVTASA